MPTNTDLVLLYQAKAEPPPFHQAFDPSAGFPWPRIETPTLPRKRPVWGASVVDTTYVTGGSSLDLSLGFPWPRTERPTPAKRPNVPTGYLVLANDEYVPFEDKTHSWLPVYPDFAGRKRRPNVNEGIAVIGNLEAIPFEQQAISWLPVFPERVARRKPLVSEGRTVVDLTEFATLFDPAASLAVRPVHPDRIYGRRPNVAEGRYVRGIPTDQFLGDPYLTWFRQASEPIVKVRRPNVATGITVLGVPASLFLGELGWYRQPVERPAVARRPIIRTGIFTYSNDVYVPIQDRALSWWRQPSERLHRRKPFYYRGFIAFIDIIGAANTASEVGYYGVPRPLVRRARPANLGVRPLARRVEPGDLSVRPMRRRIEP